MKRNRSTLLGVSLTALAMMIIVLGCSSSNPVAPQTSGVAYENPQYSDGYPQVDPDQPFVPADREDVSIEAVEKATPDIVEYHEGDQIDIDAVRLDDELFE